MSDVIDNYTAVFGDKKRIMAIFSHPDDLEVFAGGTIARLTADGKEVCSVKVTSGDKGSRQENVTSEELSLIREREDSESMRILGVLPENNIYLRVKDGTIENNEECIKKIVREIRRFKPDIVITHNPEHVVIRFGKGDNWINHKDHRSTGKSAVDAVYPYSRDILFFPEQLTEEGLSSHICTEFLLVDYYDHVDEVAIDVTNYIDQRVDAHSKHASQYSREAAQSMADFFTILPHFHEGHRYERFRHVVID